MLDWDRAQVPRYLICGLRVESERVLPGALPMVGAETDVTIRADHVPRQLDNAREKRTFWEHSEDAFLWRMPGLGRFVARGGSELVVEADPGAEIDDLLPFVLGTGLGALLYQRGGVALHASAVAFDGRAYALCGASGAGKSTLAAALCRAGAEFLSDDVTRISLDDHGRPMVSADGRSLKLTPRSIDRLGLEGQMRVRSEVEKFYVSPPREAAGDSRLLAGVYFLRFDWKAEASTITDMPRLAAAQRLLEESYRPRMALALMRGDQPPRITAAILRHAGAFALTRPETLSRLDESVERLLDHWRSNAA